METKKTPKANLEKGKTLSILMGLIVALSVVFVSFEWGSREVQLLSYNMDNGWEWPEEIPYTRPEPPPPPPPPPAPADILTVVENTVEIENVEVPTSEDNLDSPSDFIPPPPVIGDDEEEDEFKIFIAVEEMPQFPGGESELFRFLNGSIRYPAIAQENGREGRVVCSFIVDIDGSIIDAEIFRGIDPSLDKEALRVIRSMPKWKPGRQSGKAVRVKYTVPITFRLQK